VLTTTLNDRIFRIGTMVDANRLNLDMRTLKVDLEMLALTAIEEERRRLRAVLEDGTEALMLDLFK
jgi:urease accessory protein UreE